MPNYKIIATDLDGTLLKNDMTVSRENRQAIKELTERKVFVVPCSGRTYTEMPLEVRNNLYVRYVIHSDGAAIFDKHTGKRYSLCMPHELGLRVLDILREYHPHCSVRHKGVSYIDEKLRNDEASAYYQIGDYYRDFFYETNVAVRDFDSRCRAMDEIEMICAFFHEDEKKEECKRRLEALGELTIASSDPHNIEIYHKTAGKGNALLYLADILGVGREQTIAVGDSHNDLSMIEAAGLGLAMQNACDEAKALADEIICSNEEHAMAYILSHYIQS